MLGQFQSYVVFSCSFYRFRVFPCRRIFHLLSIGDDGVDCVDDNSANKSLTFCDDSGLKSLSASICRVSAATLEEQELIYQKSKRVNINVFFGVAVKANIEEADRIAGLTPTAFVT